MTVKDSPVKAVADGTVIFSGWTADTGHVIIIEHGSWVSVYKHNASLTKEQGDLVEAGEVIATVELRTLLRPFHLNYGAMAFLSTSRIL
ncbi:MAG: M23 family metallopeptidase [Flavobacteriaceae bacterium]